MSGSGRILVRSFRKEWRALGIATLATILVTLAELAGPVPLALVVDRVLEKGGQAGGFELTNADLWLLAAAAGMLLGIALVQGIVSYYSDVSLTRAAERIVHDLRLATHVHLQRLSLLFHARRPTGDLVTRVTGDVNAVGTLFSESLATMFSAVLLLAGMIVVSVVIDPVLALVAFAGTPLLALVSFHASRNLKQASRAARKRDGEIASLTAESFAAIREVKAFGSEPYEHGRLRSKSEERLHAGYDVTRIQSRFARLIDLIGAIGTAAVLVVGVFRVSGGVIGPGELVVMVAYASKMYRPLRTIAKQAGRISNSMARAERITEILAADDMLEERPGAYDGPPAAGALELDAVSFEYEPGRSALVNASLRVEAGSRVALVGRSGAGKSTVAALIARFYDPTSGRVLVDGRDLRDCSLAWLRRQVGLVLQDTVLFSGTVAENIAYGFEAARDEIEAAAKAAGAHEFISELPNGYETELGPRGIGLSGGQRQRIAIARTILRDPSILILDEPTTGLDAESEAHVLAGLFRLMRGRTTVIVSHSSRLIACADRAVSIENGCIGGDVPVERSPDFGDAARKLLRTVADVLAPDEPAPAPRVEPARRTPVPDDPALTRLPALLDPDAMAMVLLRSLGPQAPLRDVRIHYVRYTPGARALVHYDVGLDGGRYDAYAMIAAGGHLARRATKAENLALAHRVNGRSPAPMPLYYEPELDALVQWYPLDLDLPALAEHPVHLLEELESRGIDLGEVDGEPETLKYRPRHRAVLRVGEHVLKIYGREKDFALASAALRFARGVEGVRTAALEGELPAWRVTVQPLLPGSPPRQPADVATEAGELLRALQRSGTAETSARAVAASLPALPGRVDAGRLLLDVQRPPESYCGVKPPSEQMAAAAASARFLAAIKPTLEDRLTALVRVLGDGIPWIDDHVLSHGNFSGRQLLVTPDGLAVIDLDAMCLAPAALDLASYSANLVNGRAGDLALALDVLEQLVEGYGDRPDGLSWYFATCALRHAMSPFRYLDEHWPERVEGIVAAAETSLATR